MFKSPHNDVSRAQFSKHTDVSSKVEGEVVLSFSLYENMDDIHSRGFLTTRHKKC